MSLQCASVVIKSAWAPASASESASSESDDWESVRLRVHVKVAGII